VTATPSVINVIAIGKVNPDNIGIAVAIMFLCPRNETTFNIGFSNISSCDVRFPAAILEKLVNMC